MTNEAGLLAKEERRAARTQSWEDSAVMRLVSTLPRIEQLVFDSPDQSETEFVSAYQSIAVECDLTSIQEKLALEAFQKYQHDRAQLRAYVAEISPGWTGTDINSELNQPQRKAVLLSDIGDKKVKKADLTKFQLENVSPSCLVIRFDGTSAQLNRLIFKERRSSAAGFFIERLELDEQEAKNNPDKARRLSYLSGKVVFVTNPPIEEQKMLVGSPKTTKRHEIRHYLFLLYWGRIEKTAGDEAHLDSIIRNELQAHLISNDNLFDIESLLPNKLTSGKPVQLADFPQTTEQLVDCLEEIERLSEDKQLLPPAGVIILTAENLPSAVRRLRKIDEQQESINYEHILNRRNEIKDPDQIQAKANNMTFFTVVVRRFLAGKPDINEARKFVEALSRELRGYVNGGIGYEREDRYQYGPVVIAEIKALKSLIRKAGYPQEARILDRQIRKVRQVLRQEKETERKEQDWQRFLLHLQQTSPELYTKYQQLAGHKNMREHLNYNIFIKSKIDPLFDQWRKEQTQP